MSGEKEGKVGVGVGRRSKQWNRRPGLSFPPPLLSRARLQGCHLNRLLLLFLYFLLGDNKTIHLYVMLALLTARSFHFRAEFGDKLSHRTAKGYRNSQQSLHQGKHRTQGSIQTTPFQDITPLVYVHSQFPNAVELVKQAIVQCIITPSSYAR